jgi:hypothetical protein
MTTLIVFSASTLPTSSVEKNRTMCSPSFEWSPGALTITELPSWTLPPSTVYAVWLTPAPVPSFAERLTVTGALLGLPGASDAEVTGAVWSTSTVIAAEEKTLPARSVVVTRTS